MCYRLVNILKFNYTATTIPNCFITISNLGDLKDLNWVGMRNLVSNAIVMDFTRGTKANSDMDYSYYS